MTELLYVEILTKEALDGPEAAMTVLDLWKKWLPSHLPDRIGSLEPITFRFDGHDGVAWANHWKWPFLSKRTKPRMESEVFMRRSGTPAYATWLIRAEATPEVVRPATDLVAAAAAAFHAEFGCVTILSQREIKAGTRTGTVAPLDKARRRFNFFVPSDVLTAGIPDFYWVTVLGEPHVSALGRERLLSAPVYHARPIGSDAVLLQLTRNIEDSRDELSFETLKEALYQHLGIEAGQVHKHPARRFPDSPITTSAAVPTVPFGRS